MDLSWGVDVNQTVERAAIVLFCLAMGVVEIGWLGGRPQVLTFLLGLLGLPFARTLDFRRNRMRDDDQ